MFSSVIARGKASLQGKEAEQRLANLLHNEEVQVISSFELNQIASLTYHEAQHSAGERIAEKLTDMIEEVLSKPATYTPLALQKTLIVTKHILLYGAERILSSCLFLGKYVEGLLNYNTVLIAQQQQGAAGMLLRIKGGGVDKGGPVREAAQQVHALLSSPEQLRFERNTKADPNSLVPVGNDQAVFVSDDLRLYALKKRMDEQQRIITKSNLAKAEDGYGGGYTSKDGKQVVGAAHGLDEMVKMAQKEQHQFTDDGPIHYRPRRQDLADPHMPTNFAENPNIDYLSYETPVSEGDLLNFDNKSISVAQATNRYAGATSTDVDLLGTSEGNIFGDLSQGSIDPEKDLFNIMSLEGHAMVPSAKIDDHFRSNTTPENDRPSNIGQSQVAKDPNVDRFSAFDSLEKPPSAGAGNGWSSKQSGLDSLASLTGLAAPVQQLPPTHSLAPLKISSLQPPAWAIGEDDDSENGFVMGGTTGSGLNPTGPAPATPPPPPPAQGFR